MPRKWRAPVLEAEGEVAACDERADMVVRQAGQTATCQRGVQDHIRVVGRELPFDAHVEWSADRPDP